jgi:DNA-binding NtrC family response regulator
LFGKTATLSPEQMLYCLFRHGAGHLLKDVVARVGERVLVRDLGSVHGSRLNGEVLTGERTLSRGDVLRLGDTLLIFAPAADNTEAAEPELIGTSAGMVAVRRSIDLIAHRKNTVIITGETGTGKEIVARLIHQRSGRRGPFMAMNCSLFSEPLMASDLFGHVRGAFAGATTEQLGLFRATRGGTLLLDELAELPLALQASLLRVLETREVRPVGATREVVVDVRVIGTSNVPLEEMIAARTFRADLYARLAQWHIHVPPLRERREDIPALTMHLLGRCEGGGRRLTPDLAEALLVNPWPLNVRGLFNVLSTAVLTTPGLAPLELSPEVRAGLWTPPLVKTHEPTAPQVDLTKEGLEELLTRFQGKVASAARSIGVTRPKLYRMLWAHDLDPAGFRSK